MKHKVDVVIIGAGSAGLAALKEVKKYTRNYLLIDHGPIGTTCARTGCMPSKALIQIANEFHQAQNFAQSELVGKKARLKLDTQAALIKVRRLRDHFVFYAKKPVQESRARFIQGFAYFNSPNQISVGTHQVTAKRIILATGTQPIIPPEWDKFKDKILTSETIFEQELLPRSIAVIGAGPLGLELGQALSRFGIHIECFALGKNIAGLTDPQVQNSALKIFGQEFKLHIGVKAQPEKRGNKISIRARGQSKTFDFLLASIGRSANTKNMGLEEMGVALDKKSRPHFNQQTLQIQGQPIFIAGDVTGERPVLHEAVFEGRVAGHNACRPLSKLKRRTPFSITFTEPNIAIVGENYRKLKDKNVLIGQASFENQGRSVILGQNKGLLRIYAHKKTKRLLGAEMICPEAEHLAHLLVLAMEQKMSADEMLNMPFYHPTVEEGLKTALKDLLRKQ